MVNPIHCRAYSGDKIIHSAINMIKCRIALSDILFLVIYTRKIVITVWYNHDYSTFRISITIMIMITGHNFFSITIIIMITGFQKMWLRLWLQCNRLKIVIDDYDYNWPQPWSKYIILNEISLGVRGKFWKGHICSKRGIFRKGGVDSGRVACRSLKWGYVLRERPG